MSLDNRLKAKRGLSKIRGRGLVLGRVWIWSLQASVELAEGSDERRPAVQVGNPFMEKLLMEACVELAERHGDWVEGLQDLGAAGLTSSAVEEIGRAHV